jgi:hypothetical protein
LLTASEYQITFLESILDLEQRVQALTKHSSILIERRGKNYDLRPLLLSIEILIHNADEQQRLKTLLRTDSALHARPDELVNAMGIPAEKALFHRLKLHFNQELT